MPDYTILIIDYEPRNIDKLTLLFEKEGYRVEIARDGFAGIDKFDKIKPDLTLVEAMLPGRNGFDVCETVKRTSHGKNSLVFIITAVYKGRKYRWQARHQCGSDEYIEKPVSDEDLLETVRRSLSRRAAAASSAGSSEAVDSLSDKDPAKARPADV